jgi:hypothetical protein
MRACHADKARRTALRFGADDIFNVGRAANTVMT